MSYDWGKTWQAVGGTIWTSEDNRPQWQGLTDEERAEIAKSDPYRPTEMLKLAEAKLREKNND